MTYPARDILQNLWGGERRKKEQGKSYKPVQLYNSCYKDFFHQSKIENQIVKMSMLFLTITLGILKAGMNFKQYETIPSQTLQHH